jgi:hypothetical protein
MKHLAIALSGEGIGEGWREWAQSSQYVMKVNSELSHESPPPKQQKYPNKLEKN